MSVGYLISVYDRVDDCMAHLDILKYDPAPHQTLIVSMSEALVDRHGADLAGYDVVSIQSPGFALGPLLSLVRGVREAKERGWKWLVYRNADDWLFNHSLASDTITHMEQSGQICAGYNWLSKDTLVEFTMNELYLSVDHFARTADDAENYFVRSKPWLCEYKMGRWLRRTIEDDSRRLYRLPDREIPIGIGNMKDQKGILAGTFLDRHGVRGGLADNNRFFNRKWQLIGSHDNQERLKYYTDIWPQISYATDLERERHFRRWMRSARTGESWNVQLEGSKQVGNRKDREVNGRPRPIVRFKPKQNGVL